MMEQQQEEQQIGDDNNTNPSFNNNNNNNKNVSKSLEDGISSSLSSSLSLPMIPSYTSESDHPSLSIEKSNESTTTMMIVNEEDHDGDNNNDHDNDHHHLNEGLNEEELKKLAQSLAPRVTSLLDTNEQVIENIINDNLLWTHHEYDDSLLVGEYNRRLEEEEEDGMEDEWNGLSNAEQMLTDELGMISMGFNFVVNQSEDEYDSQYSDDSLDDKNYDDNESSNSYVQQETYHHENVSNKSNDDDGGGGGDFNDDNVHDGNISNKNLTKIEEGVPGHGRDSSRHNKSLLDETNNVESGTKHTTDNSTPLSTSSTATRKHAYTLYDHAKYVDLQFAHTDLGYPTCPLLTASDAEALLDVPSFRHEMLYTKKNNIVDKSENHHGSYRSELSPEDDDDDLQRAVSSRFNDQKSRREAIREILSSTREYIKPMTRSALSRIYVGLVDRKKGLNENMKQFERLENEIEHKAISKSFSDDNGDEIVTSSATDGDEKIPELLPIRTIAIQIRPDVLCGAVMDATHTAINSLRGEITKRQGNHLRGLVPGCWVPASSYMAFHPEEGDKSNNYVNTLSLPEDEVVNGMCYLPPFVVDAQLCTKKRSRDGERVCLFRFFRITESQVVDGTLICPPSPPHATTNTFNPDLIPDLKECNNILRESSALYQRMRMVATKGGNIAFDVNDEKGYNNSPREEESAPKSKSLMRQVLTSPIKLFSPSQEAKAKSPQKMKKSISVRFRGVDESVIHGGKAARTCASQRLLKSFLECPSVISKNENPDVEPIPSLSKADWPFVQSSWRYITMCLNEFDNRDLNYSSLVSCPFGAFPALPTLDSQLCSQIKTMCKDSMVISLLKGAQELEEFARESEYSCAKLIQLLQPTFSSYNLESPIQPEAVSLSSYPLDFISPEVSCPPWGQRVVEVLNWIAAKSPIVGSESVNNQDLDVSNNIGNISESEDNIMKSKNDNNISKSEFQKAREAVSMVVAAFMKQEDEELSARLGRKNLQVMDRLAKMQAHKRNLVITIRDSYGTNVLATKYADRVHTHAELFKEKSLDKGDSPLDGNYQFYPASDQVPLVTCRSLSGKVPATCFVTYHQILLVTSPIIGATQICMCKLSDALVQVHSPKSKSILNPIPSTVSIVRKSDTEEMFTFRPLMGARVFKDFVDLIMSVASESEENLQFSSSVGLQHIFDEKAAVEKAALGNKY